ncbi:MAG: hypothetical protein RL701_2042 [Pseudomonadota bacterium]|jgi:ubiquinone biosynthesis protein
MGMARKRSVSIHALSPVTPASTDGEASETSEVHISRKHKRRLARRKRRERSREAAALKAQNPPSNFERRSFLSQVEDVLMRIERGARELRSVTNSAANAIEFAQSKLGDANGAAGGGGAGALKNRAARVHKTGLMLAQLVFGYRMFGLRTAFASEERTAELRDKLHADNAARFTRTSLEQGGAFLKLGQLLSARADLLPEIWVSELSTLQDAAQHIPSDEARAALTASLGAAPEECFAEFNYEPIAAASIGQVHRALTKEGLQVAVKLQRPGIAARIEDDLALLDLTMDALRGSLPPLDLDTITKQIREHIRAEVDYKREAALTARAAAFFQAIEGLTIPEPVAHLCTAEVLTTRFIEGRKITVVLDELVALREAGDASAQVRISELLGRLLQSYLRQMLELGMFQADPHPGNLMVTSTGELAILDFGCAAELTDEVRRAYLALLGAFFASDRERSVKAFEALGFRTQSGRPDTLLGFMDALLGELAEAVQSGSVQWPDREAIAKRAAGLGKSLTADPVVTVPGHFVMIGRVLATIGGLFSHYRPDLDIATHVLPVLAATLGEAA